MIEQFLQKKVAELLGQFVQFEKNKLLSMQGLTLTKSKIKPKLVEIMSQILGMPLQLSEGMVDSIKFNMPWQKLFLINNSAIKLSMQGFRIKTKLRNKFNYAHITKCRQGLIKHLTSKLISDDQKTSPLVKKLKQYFMDSLQLQIKDIQLEIQVDLQHKIELIFAFDSISARQQRKTNTLKVNAHRFSVSYKVANSRPEPLLYPTNMQFTRKKQNNSKQIVSQKSISIETIHLNINNHNFNDIRRFLCLVSWHNSFMHLPVTLWRDKPLSIIKTKPLDKLKYYSKLVLQNIHDRNIKKTLQERKIYNSIYTDVLKGSKDFTKLQALNAMEDKMYVWKIVAYRNFCIQKLKEDNKRKNEQIEKKIKLQQIPEKDVQQNSEIVKAENKLNGFSWMKSWFRTQSNEKELIQELEQKLDKIQTIPTVSVLSLTINQILINIVIITYTAKQNFLLAKASDITYKYEYDDDSEQQRHQVICGKFRISYEQYLGHDKKYRYLLETQKEGEILSKNDLQQSESQFQQVQNFLQFRNFPNFFVRIEPLKVCINHQIIERLSVFDVQALENSSYEVSEMKIVKHLDPYIVLKQMNKSFSQKINAKQVVNKIKQISKCEGVQNSFEKVKHIQTGLLIIIPQQMAKQLCPCNEVVITIQQIQCKLIGQDNKFLNLEKISLKCNFPQQNSDNYEILINIGQIPIKTVIFIYPFSISLFQNINQKEGEKQIKIQIKQKIQLDFHSNENVGKLIKLFHHFKPAKKQTRNLYHMRMRRKQSIGQEFIDACQNLNEHIVKSAISTTQIKPKKYSPILQKKLVKIALIINQIKIKMDGAFIQISHFIIEHQNQSNQSTFLFSQNQKKIKFQIHQIKRFSEYVGNIMQIVKKISPQIQQFDSKVAHEDELDSFDKKQELKISNINFQLNAFHSKSCFLKIELKRMMLIKQEQQKSLEFYFITNFKNKVSRQADFIPLIQQAKVIFIEKKSYNTFVQELIVSPLVLDFTPQIFKFLTKIYRIYLESLQNKMKIQNNTLNDVRMNSTGNRYNDLKAFQAEIVGNEKDCNIIIFGSKIELNLNSAIQTHFLTQNCCLVRRQKQLKIHALESNIKIVNLQDKTLWVNVGQSKGDQISFPPKTNQIIDVKYLSAAKSFEFDECQFSTRPRGSSVHRKSLEREQNSQRINMPLKAKQQYHILVSSDEHYLKILDQGESFKEVKICQIIKQKQIVIANDDDQYLILRCIPTYHEQFIEYRIQILSPIYIVNKLPWKINYRIGKEAFDVQQMVNTEGRTIRKRSFQAIPLQKIMPLQHNKIRSILYRQIFQLHITLDQFSGSFKISNIIESMEKQKDSEDRCSQSSLICLSNGKKNIQLILKLQISDQTLKIKVFPQYVFINLCEINILLKIKQMEYTYPQIKLKTIKQGKKGHNLTKDQEEIQSFVKTYVSFANEKFNQKQILQQLFSDFEEKVQIFAGTINKKLKRYFIYQSGTKANSSISGGYNSTGGGYTSGYGSGSDAKQYLPNHSITELCHQSLIEYGMNKSLVYYRNIKIEEYFNLVFFVPTIKIINKSTSIFMIKSKATKTLIKVEGQQMNYLTVNSQGFSIQSIDQHEQVNLNEWFNINTSILGTVYYAKEMSLSGYESKQYTLRKKKLRKRPKIFYRVVLSQHERGIQVLIEQSQYPPISFINNTHLKLKLEEEHESFQQELGPNQMAQFAPIRNPYGQPLFKLYYAQHYEYLFVQNFHVEQFKVIPCSKSSKFVISVEQFKDKKIVVFGDQKFMQMSERKNQNQIQKVKKFIVSIDSILLSFMNDFYKQVSALKISNVQFQLQEKNEKQYLKFKVNDIQGYDFSGIQPNYTFQKLKQDNSHDMFRKTFKANVNNQFHKTIFNSNLVISYHKNATIVEKCHIRLASLKIVFNSFLVLQSIKVYQNQILSFFSLLSRYSQPFQKRQSHSQFLKKQFIFQSFVWEGTSLTFKCQNLNIFCIFLDKAYYKWIINFLEWVGDLKPIKFSSHSIQYQNYTIQKLIKKIDVKKKVGQFAKILFDYPLRQLLDISSVFFGHNQKRPVQKLNILIKVFKGFGNIIYRSGLLPVLSTKNRKNKQENDHLSYREEFQQTHSIRTKQTIIDKIQLFEYAEWRYELKFSETKLNIGSIDRMQRYNARNEIIAYDLNIARIKVALDSFHGNKIHKNIEMVQKINSTLILGLTEEYLVLYFIDKQQWKVKKHEQIISIDIVQRKQNGRKIGQALRIVATLSQNEIMNGKQFKSSLNNENFENSKLDIYEVNSLWIKHQELKQIKDFIASNKLISEF